MGASGPDRAGDGHQPDHPHVGRRGDPAPLPHPVLDGAAPRPGREYGLRRLPAPGKVSGRDRFLPRQFQFRGDRLAFTIGIAVLAILAGVLIVVFQGSVTALIPLYTVGVFIAFTLSQSGMVVHWWRLRDAGLALAGDLTEPARSRRAGRPGRRRGQVRPRGLDDRRADPATGGHDVGDPHHYHTVEAALDVDWTDRPLPIRTPRVIVPISRLDRPAFAAVAYARAISDDVRAVHVVDDREAVDEMQGAGIVGRPGQAGHRRVAVSRADRASYRVHRRDRGAQSQSSDDRRAT